MFDTNKPIHLLKLSEVGLDIHLFEYYFRERCGLKVRFIKPELQELIQCTRNGVGVKDNFVLKLTGSGKGKGIIFGTDISTEAWLEYLTGLSEPQVSGLNYVIQRVARQPKFDVIVPSKSGKPIVEHNYVVETFMMVHGEQLGNACWRTGPGRICAISHGGSWMCSLVQDSNVAPVLTMGRLSLQNSESN